MKKLFVALTALCAVFAFPARAQAGGDLVYIGSHAGTLRAVRFDPVRGTLASTQATAANPRPTYATTHPTLPVLYVNRDSRETSAIEAYRFERKTGALAKLGEVATGSTYLWFDAPSQTLLSANYGGGSVSSIPVARDGTLGTPVSTVKFTGSGPSPRQTSPHAHSVRVDPTGRYVLVADLGADRVWVLPFDRRTRMIGPYDQASAAHHVVSPGSGPRHMAMHPNGRWLYMTHELTANVETLRWDAKDGRLTSLQLLSTDAPDFTGTRSASEVAVSADGRFVYVANRSDSSMVVHRVDPAKGTLTQIQRIASGGRMPWHFAIHPSGRWLLVANRDSDRLNLFRVDRATGLLTDTGTSLSTPQPVNVRFAGR